MNFTLKVKNQIIGNGLENACCKQAALAAFLRLAGSVISVNGSLGFEVVTECECAAEFFINLLEEMYSAEITITGAKKDNLSGRDKITFGCRGQKAERILLELGIVAYEDGGYALKLLPDKYVLENDCCKQAYIKGAFLASGSCVVPAENKNGYHLEVVFSVGGAADDFADMLIKLGINAKTSTRKDSSIVYLKSGSDISDMLALMGASLAVLEINDIMAQKSLTNDINRAVNCMAGNLVKQMDASVKYIRAIEKLERQGRLNTLLPELLEVAKMRKQHENSSLSELAELLGISKSSLSRRLKKIMDLADEN